MSAEVEEVVEEQVVVLVEQRPEHALEEQRRRDALRVEELLG